MQQTFSAATAWDMDHPWGSLHPHVVATTLDGRTFIAGPEHTLGHVKVTFGRATAGKLELIGPGGAGLVDDLSAPAQLSSTDSPASVSSPDASGHIGRPAAVVEGGAAIIHPGQGAVVQ